MITLYKNCILQNDYTEVIDHSKIYDYLNGLEKLEINQDVFYLQNGSFNIVMLNSYDYNYAKINDPNGYEWFCFITNIVAINNVAKIEYELDVWATFFHNCTMRTSILERSLWYSNAHERELPLDYESNSPLKYNFANDPNRHYRLVLCMQYYDLTSSGEGNTSNRRTVVLIDQNWRGISFLFEFIQLLLQYQSTQNFARNAVPSEKFYYDIINVYVLPDELIKPYLDANVDKLGKWRFHDDEQLLFLEAKYITNFKSFENTIEHNFKYISYGCPVSQIELKRNGISTNLEYLFSCDTSVIKIIINANGNSQDITDSFKVDIPFTAITGETAALRNISDKITAANATGSLINSAVGIVGGIGTGIASLASGNVVGGISGFSRALSGASGIGSGIEQLNSAYADKYQTSHKANPVENAIMNAVMYNCVYELVPYNEDEVNAALYNNGYKVLYSVDNLYEDDYVKEVTDYNVVKFAFVRLYGKCPQDYLNKLKQILVNGVKIWYDIQRL